MSALHNAHQSQGHQVPPDHITNLLANMKLNNPKDEMVNARIMGWVSMQKLPHGQPIDDTPVGLSFRISVSLLLQRIAVAFEQRAVSAGNGTTNANPQKPKPQKSKLSIEILMMRKVKVTRLVLEAVQFVGSDLLKVLQILRHPPNLVDVASLSLKMLANTFKITQFYSIFSAAMGKSPATMDESHSTFFGVFALQSLQSLRAQAIAAYQFAHDFEFLYGECYKERTFMHAVHVLNPVGSSGMRSADFEPDTEARNICWKMARLLALNEDFKTKSDPETKDYRRKHVLIAATSILLVANMGKSIENSELEVNGSKDARPPVLGDIPTKEDFVAMVSGPVSQLLQFIEKHALKGQPVTPISTIDIRSNFQSTCALISQLPSMKFATGNVTASEWRSRSLLAKYFTPCEEYHLLQKYRILLQELVSQTDRDLRINSAVNKMDPRFTERMAIVNVMYLYPMVIGEPWGIHRYAPIITSKMLCASYSGTPPENLKTSVAVVQKCKPRTKTEAEKRQIFHVKPDAVFVKNKKAKSAPSPEIPGLVPKSNSPDDTIDLVGDDSSHTTSPPSSPRPAPIPTSVRADITSPTPKPMTPIDVTMDEIEPPVVNDSTELNEWVLSIMSLSVIKPSDSLLTYLGEHDRSHGNGTSCLQNVVIPTLNRCATRIQSSLRAHWEHASNEISTQLTLGQEDGQVYVNGKVDKVVQVCASVVGFYYHSLEAIIRDQMKRIDFLGSFDTLLQREAFHRALLASCYVCVIKGVGKNNFSDLSTQVVLDTTETDAYVFLKAIETLCNALVATKESDAKQAGYLIIPGLPKILLEYIQKVETQVIDSMVWNSSKVGESSFDDSSLPLAIKTLKSFPGAWPPDVLEPMLPEEMTNEEAARVRYKPSFASSSEANFVSFVLRALLKNAMYRIQAMCATLDLQHGTVVHTEVLVAFRYLLRYHISLFNDRHVDQLIMCSMYGVCRVMKVQPEITFGKIIDAYLTVRGTEQGDRVCRAIVRHVKLLPQGGSPGRVVGNIVGFYNEVYVPKMQKYFIGSKSLNRSKSLYLENRRKKHVENLLQKTNGSIRVGGMPANQTDEIASSERNKSEASASRNLTSTKPASEIPESNGIGANVEEVLPLGETNGQGTNNVGDHL